MACSEEKTVLVYTLLNEEAISFEEFDLIIRSLHNFKLLKLNNDPESKTITVELGYFANVANARKRLAGAAEFIDVQRESTNIAAHELPALQRLRAKFGLGRSSENEECQTPKPYAKKRRYANCS